MDYSTARNNFNGYYNAPNVPNIYAFAALKSDGSITAWGSSSEGGSGAPTDSGYTHIYSAYMAFAALKPDGSITAWGSSSQGGSGAPTDSGYTHIYSTGYAFAALKPDGSITAWGSSIFGGSGAPTDSGYTKIYSTYGAFVALKSDGSITVWGHESYGGTGATTGTGYVIPYGGDTCSISPLDINVPTAISTQSTQSTPQNITTDVQDVLSLDCTHDNTANDHIVEFGNLTPGTPVTASTTCTVTTNSDQGYTLAVKRNTIDATMDKDGEDTTNIPDRTAWNPTGTGNAQQWQISDANLAFTIYDTTATKDTTWWGTGTTQTDANNKYAGFPTDYTNIMNHTQYNQTATTTNIGYKLDVPTTQKSGIYSGDITYQVTTAP